MAIYVTLSYVMLHNVRPHGNSRTFYGVSDNTTPVIVFICLDKGVGCIIYKQIDMVWINDTANYSPNPWYYSILLFFDCIAIILPVSYYYSHIILKFA